jgi:PAS domain S-box-containing protein
MSETVTLSSGEYRILVEQSPVMIWRSGPDARCDYFNQTWLAFTGRTLAQELGDGWVEGVHPEDVARCVQHYLDHFERREPFEMEYRLRRHDGEYRWLFDRGVPNFVDGRFVGFIGSCIDVEDRWRARQAQHEALEREQEARRQAEALAAEVTAQCQSVEAMMRALQSQRGAP